MGNKKCKNFNIYNIVFFFKKKKNTWIYHCFRPVYQKSWWYDLQFLRYRMWQTEIVNYGSFFAPSPKKPKKSEFWKTEKNYWRYHFTHAYQKPNSYEIWFLRQERDRQNFLSFWAIFCSFTSPHPQQPSNQNFEKWKNEKSIWRCCHLLHRCAKNHNHMMCTSWDME